MQRMCIFYNLLRYDLRENYIDFAYKTILREGEVVSPQTILARRRRNLFLEYWFHINKLLVLGVWTTIYVPTTVLPLKPLHLVTYAASLSPEMSFWRFLAIWQPVAGEFFFEKM